MIGVHANPGWATEEFFELFKIGWERYVPGRRYDAVIVADREIPRDHDTKVFIVYSSQALDLDRALSIEPSNASSAGSIEYHGVEFPVYGAVRSFGTPPGAFLYSGSRAIGFESEKEGVTFVRIGCDLLQEVAMLLGKGQPAEHAAVPTLELHIAILRDALIRAHVSFAEIPPVPAGHDFIACLTHDVDFTRICQHRFDSTIAGFLYRALIGSLIRALTGKLSWKKCRTNWRAALSLPLVYFGAVEDFWLEFDRYLALENEMASTFFFIPYRNRPGRRNSGSAPRRRSAKYDVNAIADEVRCLSRSGCEVGLHGIDAWNNREAAQQEKERISHITGSPILGVRMHWLYWGEHSPRVLDDAGFAYDSTFGYNQAVGFRGGTTQVFRPGPTQHLLELPLHLQDTALFYSGRMNLSEARAFDSCRELLAWMKKFGGVFTLNWHTRSLSPERLWGDFYRDLLSEMKKSSVWFATAGQAVEWFRQRRRIRIEPVESRDCEGQFRVVGAGSRIEPPLTIRIHGAVHSGASNPPSCKNYYDVIWNGDSEWCTQDLLEMER